MARNLCDFYVLSSTKNLVAKYVNAVLSQSEAQHTANALHKQYGAFVCGIDKGPVSGPPRAPTKSPNTSMPSNLPVCWVQAGSPAATEQAKPKTGRYLAIPVSKGAAPQRSPLAPVLSTSFLKPQLIAGAPAPQGAQPMFRWIEKGKPVRDERAIEARLRGVGRDEANDESALGAAFSPGSVPGRAGPHQTTTVIPGGQLTFGDPEYLLYQHTAYRGDARYTVTINKRLAVGGRAANIWIGYTLKKNGQLFVRVILNHTKVVYDGPATTVSVTGPEKKFFTATPNGKGFIELDYVANYSLSGAQTGITPSYPGPGLSGSGTLGDVTDTLAYQSCMANAAKGCDIQREGMIKAGASEVDAHNTYVQCIQQADKACRNAPGASISTSALQAKINKALAAAGICTIGADGKLGPTTCHAALYVSKYLDQSVIVPAACGDILASGKKSLFDPECKIGNGGGGGAPKDPCASVTCPAGQHCENGKCVADPVKPAAEEPKKSSWLWLLALGAGGLAIAGAAGLFPKAPKIPPRAAER